MIKKKYNIVFEIPSKFPHISQEFANAFRYNHNSKTNTEMSIWYLSLTLARSGSVMARIWRNTLDM